MTISLPTRFYLMGILSVFFGMIWGIQMSATSNFTLAPAHGHLNLIGFVLSLAFGTYYALTPAAIGKLAELHFWLHLIVILVMVPGIVMAITQQGELLAKLGSVLALLSIVMFGNLVLRNGVGTGRADPS